METLESHLVRHRRANQRGFTLIELLVVIAILAILAAVVLFNILGVSKSAQSNSCATDEKSVTAAAAAYYNDNTKTWPTITGLTGDGTSTDTFGGLVTTYLQQAPPKAD